MGCPIFFLGGGGGGGFKSYNQTSAWDGAPTVVQSFSLCLNTILRCNMQIECCSTPLMLVQPVMVKTTIASSNETFWEFELWIRLRMLTPVRKLVTFRQRLDFLRRIGLRGASRNQIADVE